MTGPVHDKLRAVPSVVGRDDIVQHLAGRFREADDLQVVYVEGDEGMGTTTLLAKACEVLGAEDGAVALFARLTRRDAVTADSADSAALALGAYSTFIWNELGEQLPGEHADELAGEEAGYLRSLLL